MDIKLHQHPITLNITLSFNLEVDTKEPKEKSIASQYKVSMSEDIIMKRIIGQWCKPQLSRLPNNHMLPYVLRFYPKYMV